MFFKKKKTKEVKKKDETKDQGESGLKEIEEKDQSTKMDGLPDEIIAQALKGLLAKDR